MYSHPLQFICNQVIAIVLFPRELCLAKKMLNLSRIKGFLQGSSTLVKRSYILYCLFQELFKFSVYFGHLPTANPKRLYILYQYETIAVNKIKFFLDFFRELYLKHLCFFFSTIFKPVCLFYKETSSISGRMGT